MGEDARAQSIAVSSQSQPHGRAVNMRPATTVLGALSLMSTLQDGSADAATRAVTAARALTTIDARIACECEGPAPNRDKARGPSTPFVCQQKGGKKRQTRSRSKTLTTRSNEQQTKHARPPATQACAPSAWVDIFPQSISPRPVGGDYTAPPECFFFFFLCVYYFCVLCFSLCFFCFFLSLFRKKNQKKPHSSLPRFPTLSGIPWQRPNSLWPFLFYFWPSRLPSCTCMIIRPSMDESCQGYLQ